MFRTCKECKKEYDDFDHLTICPHEWFPICESARKLLEDQGVCPCCGRREGHRFDCIRLGWEI